MKKKVITFSILLFFAIQVYSQFVSVSGNKFQVGYTGNKKTKFVEAAKGTNLFFAIYQDQNGKRNYN